MQYFEILHEYYMLESVCLPVSFQLTSGEGRTYVNVSLYFIFCLYNIDVIGHYLSKHVQTSIYIYMASGLLSSTASDY